MTRTKFKKKRSYEEFRQDRDPSANSSDVGLGATLAQLRDPQAIDNPGRSSDEWKLVKRDSKKKRRKKTHLGSSNNIEDDSTASNSWETSCNRPALTFAELHKLHSSLKISDLQGLVLYCLADGVGPQWISVRHHGQVRKAVVLMVPGLEKGMFDGQIELALQPSLQNLEVVTSQPHTASSKTPLEPAISNQYNVSYLSSNRSPDDYVPIPLAIEKLSAPLRPLADIFSHLLPVKTPGDDRYYKVHSPLHAMLTAHLPKSQDEKGTEKKMKGAKPVRGSELWMSERTQVTSFIASNEELRENEYIMHPACFVSAQERDDNIERRAISKQSLETGWVDTDIEVLDEVKSSGGENHSDSLTAGRTVLALDCEMCQVEGDEFALTRISMVDWNGEVVMDELVLPDKPITNYLTQYSGITAAKLAPISTTLPDIQNRLRTLLTKQTILIGHSLNADLTAMKLTHPFIIDTSIIYPHPRGPPLKSSLKFLTQKYLGREIQKDHGTAGHDSVEDARACLDLVKQKCERGPKWGTSEATGETIFKRLSRAFRPGTSNGGGTPRTGAVVDHGAPERSFGSAASVCIGCTNDEEVVVGVKRAVLGDVDGAVVSGTGVDFTWARLRELEVLRGWANDYRHPQFSVGIESNVPTQPDSTPSIEPDSSIPAIQAVPALVPQPTATATAELSIAVSRTVQHIITIHAALPPCTLLIVYSGTGDPREMGRLQEMQRRFKKEYATKKWDELSVKWTDVEEQALRRACGVTRQGIGLVTVT